MKKILIALPFTVAFAAAFAQNQSPNPNPPVGGIANPGTLINNPIVGARRQIMRDTLMRQYSAEEISEYKKIIEAYEREKNGAYEESAKLIRRRMSIGISPDSIVEEIRLDSENVGSIVFTDTLGNPWNVDDVLVPNYIEATRKGNMIVFTPNPGQNGKTQKYGRGSITVLLEGLQTTIPFGLSYGYSRTVDSQIEAQIQSRNTKATVNTIQPALVETDEVAEQFLDGEPPKKAKEIKTSHKSVKSWIFENNLYVRTPLNLHSPAYKVFAASAAGMSVVRYDGVPPIINAIYDGEVVSVSIGD